MKYEIHDAANAFPMMGESELIELANDIRENGLKVPISTLDGKIIDGRNRAKACEMVNVEPIYKAVYVDDPYMWAWSLNGERRHLDSQEQKAVIWKKLHGMSEAMQKERARIRREADEKRRANAVNQHTPRREGACTDRTPTQQQPRPTRKAEAKAAGVNTGAMARANALLNAAPELAEKVAKGEMRFAEADREAKKHVHVSANSGNNEWYTPANIIEAARKAMGEITLDPASCELANKTVKADRFFSQENDGLAHEWSGKVWMNPPYSSDLMSRFAAKLKESLLPHGRVVEACVLVNNATETKWFQSLASDCAAICFPSGRIRYISPEGPKNSPLQGQAILYFGSDCGEFCDAMKELGEVFTHE